MSTDNENQTNLVSMLDAMKHVDAGDLAIAKSRGLLTEHTDADGLSAYDITEVEFLAEQLKDGQTINGLSDDIDGFQALRAGAADNASLPESPEIDLDVVDAKKSAELEAFYSNKHASTGESPFTDDPTIGSRVGNINNAAAMPDNVVDAPVSVQRPKRLAGFFRSTKLKFVAAIGILASMFGPKSSSEADYTAMPDLKLNDAVVASVDYVSATPEGVVASLEQDAAEGHSMSGLPVAPDAASGLVSAEENMADTPAFPDTSSVDFGISDIVSLDLSDVTSKKWINYDSIAYNISPGSTYPDTPIIDSRHTGFFGSSSKRTYSNTFAAQTVAGAVAQGPADGEGINYAFAMTSGNEDSAKAQIDIGVPTQTYTSTPLESSDGNGLSGFVSLGQFTSSAAQLDERQAVTSTNIGVGYNTDKWRLYTGALATSDFNGLIAQPNSIILGGTGIVYSPDAFDANRSNQFSLRFQPINQGVNAFDFNSRDAAGIVTGNFINLLDVTGKANTLELGAQTVRTLNSGALLTAELHGGIGVGSPQGAYQNEVLANGYDYFVGGSLLWDKELNTEGDRLRLGAAGELTSWSGQAGQGFNQVSGTIIGRGPSARDQFPNITNIESELGYLPNGERVLNFTGDDPYSIAREMEIELALSAVYDNKDVFDVDGLNFNAAAVLGYQWNHQGDPSADGALAIAQLTLMKEQGFNIPDLLIGGGARFEHDGANGGGNTTSAFGRVSRSYGNVDYSVEAGVRQNDRIGETENYINAGATIYFGDGETPSND